MCTLSESMCFMYSVHIRFTCKKINVILFADLHNLDYKPVIISLSEAVFVGGRYTTPVASLPLCGANHKSASPRLRRGHRGIEGIQPERLNAEGDSPSALSRGLSVSATPGIPTTPKRKASGGRESSRRGSRYSRSSRIMGRYDTEGYASLHPRLRATRSARAFDLSGRAAGLFYHGFSQIRADLHNIVLICAMFVLSVFII